MLSNQFLAAEIEIVGVGVTTSSMDTDEISGGIMSFWQPKEKAEKLTTRQSTNLET